MRSGAGLRIAPEVGVIDIGLVHHRRKQGILQIAQQRNDRAIVIGALAFAKGFTFQCRPCI